MARRRRAKTITAVYPAAAERTYRVYLLALVDDVRREIAKQLVPVYQLAQKEQAESVRGDSWHWDAWPEYIEAAVNAIRLSVQDRLMAGRRMIVTLGEQVGAFAKRPWQRLAEHQVGVDIFKREGWLRPLLDSWSEANSKLITSIPDQYLSQVAQRAQDMVRQGRSLKAFQDELMRQYGLGQARAKLIARTEVAKLNGQISKARQESLGIPEYEWATSGDERVRQSHKVLNGKICRWDDPTVYREPDEPGNWKKRSTIGGYIGDPGEDYQCRCISMALVENLLDQLLG